MVFFSHCFIKSFIDFKLQKKSKTRRYFVDEVFNLLFLIFLFYFYEWHLLKTDGIFTSTQNNLDCFFFFFNGKLKVILTLLQLIWEGEKIKIKRLHEESRISFQAFFFVCYVRIFNIKLLINGVFFVTYICFILYGSNFASNSIENFMQKN